MPKATSISVEKLSTAVAAAVKAASEKNPKINVKFEASGPLSLGYYIWGIPVPDRIGGALTIKETQAFANEIAGKLGSAVGGAKLQGAVFSYDGHLTIGFPVPIEVLLTR